MWSRVQIAALTGLLAASYFPDRIEAEPSRPTSQSTVLFQGVRIFDGKSDSLSASSNVLVRGNKIDKISTGPISIDNIANAITIDGSGRTLMPGLIDVHWHAMLVRPNPVEALASDIGYLNLRRSFPGIQCCSGVSPNTNRSEPTRRRTYRHARRRSRR